MSNRAISEQLMAHEQNIYNAMHEKVVSELSLLPEGVGYRFEHTSLGEEPVMSVRLTGRLSCSQLQQAGNAVDALCRKTYWTLDCGEMEYHDDIIEWSVWMTVSLGIAADELLRRKDS